MAKTDPRLVKYQAPTAATISATTIPNVHNHPSGSLTYEYAGVASDGRVQIIIQSGGVNKETVWVHPDFLTS